MSMNLRRVVTGHDGDGKAVVLLDGPPPVDVRVEEGGVGLAELWATCEMPVSNSGNAETVDVPQPIAPSRDGTIFRIVEFLPEGERVIEADSTQAFLAIGGAEVRDSPRHGGMHRTSSIDYAVVLSGKIDLLLDEDDVTLEAGDVVVQRGTFHSWANPYDQPCRIAFVLVDAARA